MNPADLYPLGNLGPIHLGRTIEFTVEATPELLQAVFGIKDKEKKMEPKKIEWKKGEPIAKLDAAPDGAPCTIVWGWTDTEGRPVRETKEGYVKRYGEEFPSFAGVIGAPNSATAITVTLPAPEWAEDRWVLAALGGTARLYCHDDYTWDRLDRYTVIRLPESVQDALDEAVA